MCVVCIVCDAFDLAKFRTITLNLVTTWFGTGGGGGAGGEQNRSSGMQTAASWNPCTRSGHRSRLVGWFLQGVSSFVQPCTVQLHFIRYIYIYSEQSLQPTHTIHVQLVCVLMCVFV